MRALTIIPRTPHSARLDEVPEPGPSADALLVRTLLLGICGTDIELVAGSFGEAPPGSARLILGHESLGVVEAAPVGCGFAPGDLVVGIVRRPDPVPCRYCAIGEWDMCVNGRFTERGLKALHGYGAELFQLEPDFAVRIDPALGDLGVLLEPTSVLAKAWDHVMRIGARARAFGPRRVLVTGAGPIGLLAALIGAQHGLEVHVFDRVSGGLKPDLVRELGGIYHSGALPEDLGPDIVIECTGAARVMAEVMMLAGASAIVCLAGVERGAHNVHFDFGAFDRKMVIENEAVFGTVNANRDHYEAAASILDRADKAWLGRLISRRVPLERWAEALVRPPDDVKVVIDFSGS
jgi:threonine dehydrogenase-like Zn-dependent dehydrogenase